MNQTFIVNKLSKPKIKEAVDLANDDMVVIIKKRNRTTEQNALYWALLTEIADSSFTVETEFKGKKVKQKVNKLDLHNTFAHYFLEPVEIKTFDGKNHLVRKSTTELTTTEFADYLEQIYNFCSQNKDLQFINDKQI
tara:strand:+ start:837 stop:1247 length:411 start_codon:yes stop_codon:yes gene_type:complete